MKNGFICSTCDKFHEGLPLSYGSPFPYSYEIIPPAEREKRAILDEEVCVIDDEMFFVRCRIEIPIIDSDEIFSWIVWVSLSEKNFDRTVELWEANGRESEPPYFGWLNSDLPYEPTTLNLKTNVHTRPIGQRPFVELEPTEHPLAVEQRNGITIKRVQQIAEQILHD